MIMLFFSCQLICLSLCLQHFISNFSNVLVFHLSLAFIYSLVFSLICLFFIFHCCIPSNRLIKFTFLLPWCMCTYMGMCSRVFYVGDMYCCSKNGRFENTFNIISLISFIYSFFHTLFCCLWRDKLSPRSSFWPFKSSTGVRWQQGKYKIKFKKIESLRLPSPIVLSPSSLRLPSIPPPPLSLVSFCLDSPPQPSVCSRSLFVSCIL